MKRFEYDDYYDDIYPSSLKRRSSMFRSVPLNFYWCVECLWHKLLSYYCNTKRLWNARF
ncbi:MAG: hypothetical protein ACUZ8N_17530 [Candidatus Scalindua sp.]